MKQQKRAYGQKRKTKSHDKKVISTMASPELWAPMY